MTRPPAATIRKNLLALVAEEGLPFYVDDIMRAYRKRFPNDPRPTVGEVHRAVQHLRLTRVIHGSARGWRLSDHPAENQGPNTRISADPAFSPHEGGSPGEKISTAEGFSA